MLKFTWASGDQASLSILGIYRSLRVAGVGTPPPVHERLILDFDALRIDLGCDEEGVPAGPGGDAAYFRTEGKLPPAQVLGYVVGRWSLEVTF